ncbi:hypothetical protein [Olleya sp. R77988]|uniref:hypothetical protein n=1 Tax=Olleya sp. R77988 TaxID=3093875 RepID=UPI0037CC6E07
MAPNKFEKQLKDTLERRTIAPSKNAWSQLDDKLQEDQNKSKFPFWWLGIAATFLGVFLAVFIFNNEPDKIEIVIDELKKEIIVPNKSNDIKKEVIVEKQLDEITIKEISRTKITSKKVGDKKAKNNSVAQTNKTINNVVHYPKIIKSANNKSVIPSKKEVFVNAVIAEQNTSNKEASLLLDEAYAKVKTNQTTYKSEKVDANSLLEEVEIKSEKSLKNRLFHAVKSGYETLKTTVVQRNN